jgi:hypothetical protein
MAKNNRVNPYLLCSLGAALLGAAFLMRPFPVLVFAGLASAIALADHAEGDFFWNKLELVLIIFLAGFYCGHGLAGGKVVPSLLQAISATLAVAAFSFARQSLGPQLGKIPLLLFLLALEYVLLKTGFGEEVVFLADSLRFKPEWTRWTSETGYLGISLWILVANHLFYLGAFRQGLSIPWLLAFLTVVLGPIIYSYSLSTPGVDRQAMLLVYGGNTAVGVDSYVLRGEWIPRTAAWVSALILLFAFVKHYIKRK